RCLPAGHASEPGSRYHRALSGTIDARSRRRRMKTISVIPGPKSHPMKLNTIEELLEDVRAGRMVVLMDDEVRENEGDLIMAAEHVRAENINFMAHFGRGLICLTLTRERCRQLRL